MGKLKELVQSESKTTNLCSVAILHKVLDKDTLKDFNELLDDPRVTGSSIARGLKKLGHDINEKSVARHRRRGCCCE
jgi:hypothetical protein